MQDSETTSFSVEVLGFPTADPGAVVASVSKFFHIPEDDARQLVADAPIKVKRGAAEPVKEALVQQLLQLGADVCVVNEQTGDTRTYRAADMSIPPPASSRGAATTPSAAPKPISISPASGGLSGAAALAQAIADRRSRMSASGDQPIPAIPISNPPPSGPVPATHTTMPPTGSVPPPSEERKSLEPCPSCSRPVEKGEVCARCGWNLFDKHRVCRQCKGDLDLGSLATRKRLIPAALLVAAIAGAVAVFLFVGPLPAGAVVAAAVAVVFFIDAGTLGYHCAKCNLTFDGTLDKPEQQRISRARSKTIAAAVLILVAAVAMPALASWEPPTLTQSSFGVGWELPVPRTSSVIAKQLHTVKVNGASHQLHVRRADREYLPGRTYWLAEVAFEEFGGDGKIERAAFEAAAKDVIATMFGGEVSDVKEVTAPGAQQALDMKIAGTDHGKKIDGVMRALAFEHNLVFVIVTGDGAAAEAPATFAALRVINDKR